MPQSDIFVPDYNFINTFIDSFWGIVSKILIIDNDDNLCFHIFQIPDKETNNQ